MCNIHNITAVLNKKQTKKKVMVIESKWKIV